MKRILSLVLSLCILGTCALVFTGCSKENSNEWPVTIGDVTIDKEPVNIVVLNDVFADILSYIGYDVKLVGRSEECDQEFLHVVPTVGKGSAPDTAAITAAKADLVIADNTLTPDAKSAIETGGAKVVTFTVPSNADELKNLYIDLGKVCGGKTTGASKGEKGYDGLIDMLATMNTVTSNVVQTVAYLYLDGSNQLCTFVKGTLEYQFFNYNGNTNVFANQTDPVVNLDELRLGSPNFIFYDNEQVLATLNADPNLAHVNAIANNHTCMIPRKAFNRFGKSAEEAVFNMLNYIEKTTKGTPDEAAATTGAAAPAATSAAPASEAPAATAAPAPAETTAPAASSTAQDDSNVITYSVEG